jgi:hypothetical protein
MPVILNPKKEYTIPYQDSKDKDFSFNISFKFPYVDDLQIKDNDDIDSFAFLIKNLKNWITKTEGIIDKDTGKEIELTEQNKMAISDMLRTLPEYIIEIAAAFMGPKGKNLLTGAMQSLTTDGQSKSVEDASQIPVVEKMDVS